MRRRVIVRPQAKLELAAASDWYDVHDRRLGDQLLREFEAAIGRIVENPLQYQKIGRRIRRVGLGKFPYGLLYTLSDTHIIITSVFHGRRNPRRWQRQESNS
jgi:plasmid stabilization system protein ParE